MNEEMKLTALVPWFGGKRTMAPEIVRQLGQHSYYFEGCCGGLSVIEMAITRWIAEEKGIDAEEVDE